MKIKVHTHCRQLRNFLTSWILCMLLCISCSDESNDVMNTLDAANQLMMRTPWEAFDTLESIDSTGIAGLGTKNRAYYGLLITEAHHKNYQSVFNDTIIYEAVKYYRRHGPDDNYARALMMYGAVLSERGSSEEAMNIYKEAEPFFANSGNMELLGLINTRLGELYQDNYVHYPAALPKYRTALECFRTANLPEREMFAHLAIASILVTDPDSTDKAIEHLGKALEGAKISGNRLCGLSAYNVSLYHYNSAGNDSLAAETVRKVISEYGPAPEDNNETDLYNAFYGFAAKAMTDIGNYDEAETFAGRIALRTITDSMNYYTVLRDVAEARKNLADALEYEKKVSRLYGKRISAGFNKQLVIAERKYDNASLVRKLQEHKIKSLAVSLILLSLLTVASIGFLMLKIRERSRKMELAAAVNDVQTLRTEILTSRNEMLNLRNDIRNSRQEIENRKEEIIKLKNEIGKNNERHRQEEEDLKELRTSLIRQASSNIELISLNGDLLKMAETIANICYVYEGSPMINRRMEDALRAIFSDESTFARADKMLEATFPGFLPELFKEFPWLTEEDRKLIVLMCCGFSTGTISIMTKMEITSLNTKKCRLARKMGISGRLSTYLRKRILDYSSKWESHLRQG